jgi:hypothetical protein
MLVNERQMKRSKHVLLGVTVNRNQDSKPAEEKRDAEAARRCRAKRRGLQGEGK